MKKLHLLHVYKQACARRNSLTVDDNTTVRFKLRGGVEAVADCTLEVHF